MTLSIFCKVLKNLRRIKKIEAEEVILTYDKEIMDRDSIFNAFQTQARKTKKSTDNRRNGDLHIDEPNTQDQAH